MSVIWTLDDNLEVLDEWFGRTVIHSHHKLHYAQAQAILDVSRPRPMPFAAAPPRTALGCEHAGHHRLV
jgi:exoribonuclease R